MVAIPRFTLQLAVKLFLHAGENLKTGGYTISAPSFQHLAVGTLQAVSGPLLRASDICITTNRLSIRDDLPFSPYPSKYYLPVTTLRLLGVFADYLPITGSHISPPVSPNNTSFRNFPLPRCIQGFSSYFHANGIQHRRVVKYSSSTAGETPSTDQSGSTLATSISATERI